MTRLNWSGGNADGLAIGTPWDNGGDGSIYIFHGSTLSSGGASLDDGDADITIQPSGTSNWFSGGFFAVSLAAGPVDSNGNMEDLIVGVANGGGGEGGAAVFYGGTASDTSGDGVIQVIENPTGTAEIQGHYFELPGAGETYATDRSGADGSLLGNTVAYLGDTRSGDGVGDIGIGFYDSSSIGLDNAIYVLRGRTDIPRQRNLSDPVRRFGLQWRQRV